MQYQVPQFTEVEDKIFGPLTLKQFVYIGGSVGLGFLLWRTIPNVFAIPLGLAIVGFGFALAFIRINKKPLISIIEAAFFYLIHNKLYLWSAERAQRKKEKDVKDSEQLPPQQTEIPAISENKLKSLAWSLDINERLHIDRERDDNETPSR